MHPEAVPKELEAPERGVDRPFLCSADVNYNNTNKLQLG
jgi:hypothetical protein